VDEEVGRWACDKCARTIVACGRRTRAFKGTGAFIGPCPWGCGAWITRAFRLIKPGEVKAVRADEWDARGATA
jgi:hypothetical protein